MNVIFNMYKIKYKKLEEMLSAKYIGLYQNCNVNLFINMENILISLSSPNIVEKLRVGNKGRNFQFISNVINLAAHYKRFFTKNGINIKIFLYVPFPFSSMLQKNKAINSDYRDYYEYKFNNNTSNYELREMIESSIEMIKIICEYIEGVYFITSENLENSLIPAVIADNKNDKYFNFIISKDIYDYQYISKDFHILYPKGDFSLVISKHNLYDVITKDVLVRTNNDINVKFLPFILSIIGSKNRNIYNIKGFGVVKLLKLIDKLIDEKVITNETTNIHILIEFINEKFRTKVMNNFYCTDIDFQLLSLNTRDHYNIISQLKDKFDNVSLKKINDKYFTEYPLQLIEVTS